MLHFRYRKLVAVGVLLVGVVVCGVPYARQYADQLNCRMTFRQVALGLHIYHDTYHRFPPAVFCAADAKPIHSWRPAILPFSLDFPQVYNWNEPWDGAGNLRLINGQHFHFDAPAERVRSIGPYDGPLDFSWLFRCRSFTSKSPFATNVVAVQGPDTAWPTPRGVSLVEIVDGPETTILLVETMVSDIMWTEPRDLEWDAMSFTINDTQRSCIGSSHRAGPCVAMANGQVYRLNPGTPPDIVRGLLTIAGGESLTIDMLKSAGWLRP